LGRGRWRRFAAAAVAISLAGAVAGCGGESKKKTPTQPKTGPTFYKAPSKPPAY